MVFSLQTYSLATVAAVGPGNQITLDSLERRPFPENVVRNRVISQMRQEINKDQNGCAISIGVITHDRRRILHFNVTKHPTSAWVAQQLRVAFPYDSVPGHLIFDRATNFNDDTVAIVKRFGITPKRTSFRSPWQNGVAERWVGNCRRDLLDHVIVLNEWHLKRLMSEYLRYYHEDRTHLALEKETPAGRVMAENSDAGCRVLSMPRLGGLHHRYDLGA